MNNAYKKEEQKLIAFKTYLLADAKLSELTAADYVKRIITVCKEENYSYDFLKENIADIAFDYTKGEKQELGRRSHNSYRSAILQFQKFVNAGGSITPNNKKPSYHFEIDQVPGEHFGTIKLYDQDGTLLDTQVTLDMNFYSPSEGTRDVAKKCINMMFEKVYGKDTSKLYEVLKMLDCSLTISGHDINL